MKTYPLVAKTFFGLEKPLAEELQSLGAENVLPVTRAVLFTGDLKLLYRVNLESRMALKVLLPIAEFEAKTEEELYRGIQHIDWSEHMELSDTFAIDPVVNSEYFKHSKYASLKAKDAIVDQFRAKFNRRPSIDVANPTIRINLHIKFHQVTVSLDATGMPLYKRGYKQKSHPAPLNEVLAAGMIHLSGWDKKTPLIDPFCGSGTILQEAAMIAQNIAPNIDRKEFAFKNWKNFDKLTWVDVRMDAIERQTALNVPLYGSDIDHRFIEDATKNIASSPVDSKQIHLSQVAIADFTPPEGPGFVITNPPYGERLRSDDLQELYETIGNRFKNHFQDYHCWVLSTKEALKNLGLKATPKFPLLNGKLECSFQHYEIYPGTKKGVSASTSPSDTNQ